MSDNPSDRSWADALEPRRSAHRSETPSADAATTPQPRGPGWQASPEWAAGYRPQGVGNSVALVVLLVGLAAALLVLIVLAL